MNDDRLRHLQRLLERQGGETRAESDPEGASQATAGPGAGKSVGPDDDLVSAETLRLARQVGAMLGQASRWCGQQLGRVLTTAMSQVRQLRAETADRIAARASANQGLESVSPEPSSTVESTTPSGAILHAQSRLRNAFVLACFLAAAFGGAWWGIYRGGGTDSATTAPVAQDPVELEEVPDAQSSTSELAAPPNEPAPAVPVPDIDLETTGVDPSPSGSSQPAPAAAKKPTRKRAPRAQSDDWQEKAQADMDAWAKQMGIE